MRELTSFASRAEPWLTGDQLARTVEGLEPGDRTGATVIGGAVVDEAVIGSERHVVEHTARADHRDARHSVRGDASEHMAFARDDLAAWNEECTGAIATPASSAAADDEGADVLLSTDRLPEDEETPPTLLPVDVGRDPAAVARATAIRRDGCEHCRQAVRRNSRPCERGWHAVGRCRQGDSAKTQARDGCSKRQTHRD